MDTPFAFVDIETTGGSVTGDRIIEIGILRVENNKVVETYETLLNPHTYISEFITGITGITSSDVENAPTFRDVQQQVYELLEGCIFVAHNARFDYGFVRNEFKRLDCTYTAKLLCTVKLSRMLFPQYPRHNLDAVIERFGIECENRHRAFGDAKVMWDFICKVKKDYPTLPLNETIQHLIKQPSLPQHLQNEDIENLSESPGVYLFYGDGDLPLYIGKSTNLHDRILSHFSGDNTSTKEMVIAQQVKRIETIRTAGDLGALLLESQLIKEKKPFYNRRLRAMEVMTVVSEKQTTDGYWTVQVQEMDTLPVENLSHTLAILPSKRAAKDFLTGVCDRSGLCKKLLGLEKTNSSCFDAKLGKCSGACIQEEIADLYNQRFQAAFKDLRVPLWPFSSPVLIREIDQTTGMTDIFLFDNWCCLTKLQEHEIPDVAETRYEYNFDLDIFKILKRYSLKKKTSDCTSATVHASNFIMI